MSCSLGEEKLAAWSAGLQKTFREVADLTVADVLLQLLTCVVVDEFI